MKKIIALLVIFLINFQTSIATVGDSVSLTEDDIIKANIFYINGEGYIKENGELKKIEGIKFYSIAGQRYIKKGDKIIKIKENKIYRINGVNYVKTNGELITLEKYLKEYPIKKKEENNKPHTFSDIFKLPHKKNIKLTYIKKSQIDRIKSNTLTDIYYLLGDQYGNDRLLNLLAGDKLSTEQLKNLREFYIKKGNIELAKKIFILENISKIDINQINRAIRAKLENREIHYVNNQQNNSSDIIDNLNLDVSNTDNTDFNLLDDLLNVNTVNDDINQSNSNVDYVNNNQQNNSSDIIDNLNLDVSNTDNTDLNLLDDLLNTTTVNNNESMVNSNSSDYYEDKSKLNDEDLDNLLNTLGGL